MEILAQLLTNCGLECLYPVLTLALASAWLSCVCNQDQNTHCCPFLGKNLRIVREFSLLKKANLYETTACRKQITVLISVWLAAGQVTLQC